MTIERINALLREKFATTANAHPISGIVPAWYMITIEAKSYWTKVTIRLNDGHLDEPENLKLHAAMRVVNFCDEAGLCVNIQPCSAGLIFNIRQA